MGEASTCWACREGEEAEEGGVACWPQPHSHPFRWSPDVDECQVLPGLCPHGECINSIGSFRCYCQAGYAPDAAATSCQGEWWPGPPGSSFPSTLGTFPCILLL